MASEEEVANILQSMKGEGNYVAITPLLIMTKVECLPGEITVVFLEIYVS